MTTENYTYTAKDGEVITGTLKEVGETVSRWYGDHNTPEFWWEFVSEDSDHQIPRKFTLDDVIGFLASVEDDHPAAVAKRLKKA